LMDLVSELIGEEGAGDLVKGFKVPEKGKEKEKEKKKEVKEQAEKKGRDAVVQELSGKLKDVKLGKSTPSTKPEPDAKPTEGPPEVKKEDNLVTEATPSDADKATA